MSVKINKDIELVVSNIGVIPISNDVAAVRGIANSGPIVKEIATNNTTANTGCIFPNDTLYPFSSIDPVITPIKGKPIPVITNPNIAGQKKLPLDNPSAGGKIKFPAPKKIANNINPTTKIFLFIYFTPFTSYNNLYFIIGEIFRPYEISEN